MPTTVLNISGAGPILNKQLKEALLLPRHEHGWEIALKFLSFNNAIFNVVSQQTQGLAKNNLFYYSLDAGATYEAPVEIPTGAYEIDSISDVIETELIKRTHTTAPDSGVSLITITGNASTLRSEISVSNTDIYVDFTKANTIRKILGFNSAVLQGDLKFVSDTVANIKNDIEAIRVRTNLVTDSYSTTSSGDDVNISSVIYSTIQQTPPGFYESREIASPIYLRTGLDYIKDINITLVNQFDKVIPLSESEAVNYVFLIRKSKY